MASYTELLPEIQPHVLGCPLPTIEQTLRVQARSFFTESQAWVHSFEETLAKNATSVTISDLPASTQIIAPLEAFCDALPMSNATPKMLRGHFGTDLSKVSLDVPRFLWVADHSNDTFNVAPWSDATYPIKGRVAIRPLRTLTEIPDGILDQFADAIVHNTLWKLFSIRNTEWYDTGMVSMHRQMYMERLEEAKDEARRYNTSRIYTSGYGGI